MPPSSKQTPLPLAPNRAALSNEISLLLSRRTALLKTLNPTSTSSSTSSSSTSRKRAAAPDADAIEQLFSGPRPNQGVGYVPERNTDGDAASARDQTLRRKLLGKNYKNGKSVGVNKGAESESDEEEGRSALGKRKRPRREEEEVVRDDGGEREGEREGESEKAGVTTDTVGELRTEEEEEEEERREEGGHDEVEDEEPKHDAGDDAVLVKGTAAISENAADEAKRDKKRKKRQREKQKQKQKREQK